MGYPFEQKGESSINKDLALQAKLTALESQLADSREEKVEKDCARGRGSGTNMLTSTGR